MGEAAMMDLLTKLESLVDLYKYVIISTDETLIFFNQLDQMINTFKQLKENLEEMGLYDDGFIH